MSTSPATPKPLNVEVRVYTGDRLLAEATCTLWLDDDPKQGALAVPGTQNWLSFAHLTLVAADGAEYRILPKRLEHVGGAGPMLLFDIE